MTKLFRDFKKLIFATTITHNSHNSVLKVLRDKAKGTVRTANFLFFCCYWKKIAAGKESVDIYSLELITYFFVSLDLVACWPITSWHLYQIWQVRTIRLNCKSLLCLCHTWHRFWCHASKQILSYAFLSSRKVIVLAIQLTQDELVSTTKHVTFK